MNSAQNHETAQGAAPQSLAAPPKPNWRLLGFLLLFLATGFVLSFLLFRYVLARVPRELVGTWQVSEGNLKGATLEFRWYGTGVATRYKNGKKEATDSSVRVRGKRIYMTSPNPVTGEEDTVIQTVVQLTDDELVIRDQDDVTYHLIRIRD